MKPEILPWGIVKAAMVGVLATLLVLPLVASLSLTKEVRLETGISPISTAGSKPSHNVAGQKTSSGEANQRNMPAFQSIRSVVPKFGTILAGTLLLLPFAASTFQMLRKHRAT